MDDATAHRALFGEGANLGHDVVARFALDLLRAVDIDVVDMTFEIGQLFGRDQPGDMLRGRQSHPHPPHQSSLVVL